MTNDRELLQQVADFLKGRTYITMDNPSLTDMVQRYQHPPLTALNRVAMQMTVRDYNKLADLLKTVDAHLKAEDEADPVWVNKQQKRRAKRVG